MVRILRASRRALHVGGAKHDETTTGVPFPAAARPGDLAVINNLSRSISGPAWTNLAGVDSNAVSYKILTAADLASPPTFSDVTNVVTQVVRGPTSLSARRTWINLGPGESSSLMEGFTKSATCMGFFSAEVYRFHDGGVTLSGGNPNPFDEDAEGVGPSSYTLYARVGLTPSLYTDNQQWLLSTRTAPPGANAAAAVYEFLF